MITDDRIITLPISIEDIRTVLGELSTDLGSLCQSPKINMWAKFKPELSLKLAPLTISDRRNNNYGIYIGTWSNLSLMVENQANFKWMYPALAKGGTNYRMHDFDGYDHHATSPIPSLPISQICYTQDGYTSIDIHIEYPIQSQDSNGLKLSDFVFDEIPLNQFYFGVILTSSKGETTTLTQAEKGLSSVLSIDFMTVPDGLYTARLFASSIPVLKREKLQEAIYIGLNNPIASNISFTKAMSAKYLTARGALSSLNSSHWSLSYSVTFHSTSSIDVTFSNNTIIVYGDNGEQVGTANIGSKTFTGALTVTGTISSIRKTSSSGEAYKSYYMTVSSSGCATITVQLIKPLE